MLRPSSAWQAVGALLLVWAYPLPAEAARYVIEIKNMSFGAPPAHPKVGDTIQWKNGDIFRHSATARPGDFDLDLAPGAQGEVTLKKAGFLTVICRYHPTMTLRLAVEKEH
jgi:plastocyanin